jgi:ATP-dependent exoDNAse (exonuclease V) beta subunit
VRVDVVSASAGTGKTWRLAKELVEALLDGSARPEGIVAVTYTVKAAGELESRIRARLLESGEPELAARVRDGYIGTIHSVCQRLLREFALEAGRSPFLEPIPESERRRLFDVALAGVLRGREAELNELGRRLALGDWKGTLRTIVDRARENGMDAGALDGSARSSRDGLAALLGKPTLGRSEYAKRLGAALAKILPALEEEATEDNRAARERAAMARALAADLRRFGLPAWKDQVQLAGKVGVRKLAPVAGDLVALVGEHPRCEAFHEDLFGMQAALFDLAGKALADFAAEKAAARVVDYGDMLAQAHEVLSKTAVQEALRARLDLVVVDEFQDTSPMQLAVVAALGGLSKRSIWVGDRKQAIFGFQGSDPDLMSAAMESALEKRSPALLSTSYRSRPPLVELASALFAEALEPHGFPREQVVLTAARPDPARLGGQPVLECWRWTPQTAKDESGKVAVRAGEATAVAAGVEALLANPPLVRERVEGHEDRLRPASRRDVAVLAFANSRCRAIAEALRVRGIPAKVSLEGLAQTPEGILARAALALLADPSDGVAALEIGWLGGAAAADPDGWLSRRFVEVAEWRRAREAAEKQGEKGPPLPLPFGDDPRVAALRAATGEASRLSPAEALDLALRTAEIVGLLRRWPEPEQRLANLEALRGEARAYENLCAARRSAGTVLGLVAHLARLDEFEDAGRQAAPGAEDAVTVSTWHKAKGLEWPVVVLSQLDHEKERSVFDVAVEPADSFDFRAPLAGRWIRYWSWPYGALSKGLALLDRAGRSPEAERARDRALRERLRLLYVGFTRARDLLVLAACVNDKDGMKVPALSPLGDAAGKLLVELPFEEGEGLSEVRVGGRRWPCRVRTFSGLAPAGVAPGGLARRWYAPGERVRRPREVLNPSTEPMPGAARAVAVTPLGRRRKLAADEKVMGPVGDALHAFLAADRGGDAGARVVTSSRLLSAHGVTGALDPETLLEAADALRAFLDARFPAAVWFREWPVRARMGGAHPRLLVGEVDLFLELPDGFVLVDHKSFPGGAAERDERLPVWAQQLGWYAQVLARATGKPLRAAYIHLPIRGEMAEVDLSRLAGPDGLVPSPVTCRDSGTR